MIRLPNRRASERWALSCACVLAACGGSTDLRERGADLAAAAGSNAQDDFKGCPADIPVFAPGLQATGKQLRLALLAAQPAQPERYANDWDVQLATPDGAPAAGATIARGQTFMPLHGHDGRVEPEITALPRAGQQHVARLNFTMRGPWEVRFWLRTPAGEDDYAVFKVCVAR